MRVLGLFGGLTFGVGFVIPLHHSKYGFGCLVNGTFRPSCIVSVSVHIMFLEVYMDS